MTEVLEHVRRTPLPWRDDGLTECGLDAASYPSLTVEAFVAKVKREGQMRASKSTCMTCWSRGSSHHFRGRHQQDEGMLGAIEREIRRVIWGGRQEEDRARLLREFTAILMLIEAHREEFDAAVTGLSETTSLAAERARRNRPKYP